MICITIGGYSSIRCNWKTILNNSFITGCVFIFVIFGYLLIQSTVIIIITQAFLDSTYNLGSAITGLLKYSKISVFPQIDYYLTFATHKEKPLSLVSRRNLQPVTFLMMSRINVDNARALRSTQQMNY